MKDGFKEWFESLDERGNPFPDTMTEDLAKYVWESATEKANAAYQWQPIETAPKSGQRILLWWRTCTEPSTGRYEYDDQFDSRPKGWPAPEEGWRSCGDQCIASNQSDCTHWMPLPKPPATAPV